MSILVVSDKYLSFYKSIISLNNDVIPTDLISEFLEPEQKHADMQILKIKDKIFLLKECKYLQKELSKHSPCILSKNAQRSYPNNIMLNYLYFNGRLYGKLSAIPKELKNFCIEQKIPLVNVNQGYSRCSTLIVSETSVITADKSIAKALSNDGADVLIISEGHIKLEGFDYGFIGGASGLIKNQDKNIVLFFGDITKHPDYFHIKDFCKKYNTEIKIVCPEQPLTDIGGIVDLAIN